MTMNAAYHNMYWWRAS